jgi:hypothetical protein
MCTINVIKNGETDDIIRIAPYGDIFKVEYSPGDLKKSKYKLFLSLDQVKQYTEDLFHLLESEHIDPFEQIQVTTRAYPAVLYEIHELSDAKIRGLLYNIIDFSLENEISIVKKESK